MNGFIWAGVLLIVFHVFLNASGLAIIFCSTSVFECVESGFPTDYVFGVFFIGIGLYLDYKDKKGLWKVGGNTVKIEQVYSFMLSLLKYGGLAIVILGGLVENPEMSILGLMGFTLSSYKQLDDRIIALELQGQTKP